LTDKHNVQELRTAGTTTSRRTSAAWRTWSWRFCGTRSHRGWNLWCRGRNARPGSGSSFSR